MWLDLNLGKDTLRKKISWEGRGWWFLDQAMLLSRSQIPTPSPPLLPPLLFLFPPTFLSYEFIHTVIISRAPNGVMMTPCSSTAATHESTNHL